MEDATTKASQDYNSEMTDLFCYNSTRTWQDMTKPHASQSLPTCATANEFSGQRTQGSVQFVFHCPSFANGPVLIFKTKTLHIVEGQVPGSSQCELFDLWTFKSFTASVLVLLSLSCWQSKKEQKAFQTLPVCYLSLLKSILAASLPSTPSTVRAPTDQLLLGPRCWELDLKEFGNGKTQQLQASTCLCGFPSFPPLQLILSSLSMILWFIVGSLAI